MSDDASDVVGGLDEPDELRPPPGSLALADPRDDGTRADWEKAAAGVLRKVGRLSADDPDAAVWDALARTTYDEIRVVPLGTRDLLDGLPTRGRPPRSGAWDVRTLSHGDNEAALADLAGGATSLWLVGERLDDALSGVLLDAAPVVLDPGTRGRAERLVALAAGAGVSLHPASNLGADPLDPDEDATVAIARLALEHSVLGVVVDAVAVHDRGASDAQEIGYSLAVGAHVLRLLTDDGLDVDQALGLIEFRYAATDEQFPTIAKLRAARRGWARIVELSDGSHGAQRQHVVTSRPMMSARDPWVNLLRATVAAFAAGVGGADAVTVTPFDSPLGEPDDFGRRIARNLSALLISEAHVAVVADPAGGAYAVERLTEDLALAAWAELGRIEDSGGVRAALEDGSIDDRIGEMVVRRDAAVATRARPITGLSEFPDLSEVLPQRGGEPDGVRRYGAAFEALRSEPADASVFVATMGSVAAFTPRAGFVTNLLAAGGVGVSLAGPTDGAADVLAAYERQPVVCLAGTDAAYADWGGGLAAALRDAGATWVVLAGQPVDGVAADDTCATGVDAVAFLVRTRERLR